MTQRIACADGARRDKAVAAALAAVRRGDLVILPTESVYALATDAFSRRGVAALREAKGYDEQVPLPVFVGARATLGGVAARVSDEARALIEAFWPGPLTVLLPPQPTLAWDLPSDAPLAVRMPLHPVALALLAQSGPLVATTANAPGVPAPTDVDDAVLQVGDAAALALDAGPLTDDDGLPSTIVDLTGPVPRVVRAGAITLERVRGVCPNALGDDDPATA